MSRHMKLPIVASLLALGILSGCSTLTHTNTLIFGTNTKFALDVSQDPTGVVGVTLGYKRQEAVWMPLLANTTKSDKSTDIVPADCAKSIVTETTGGTNNSKVTQNLDCKFAGTAGTSSTNGAGAQDTYSVLATFSGEGKGVAGTAAGKPEASAGGSLAQFFATGLAARVLAEQGSSIVNTAGGSKNSTASTPKATDAVRAKITAEDAAIDRVMYAVTDKSKVLLKDNLKTLADKAKFGGTGVKERVINSQDEQDLRSFLSDHYESAAKPLFDAL